MPRLGNQGLETEMTDLTLTITDAARADASRGMLSMAKVYAGKVAEHNLMTETGGFWAGLYDGNDSRAQDRAAALPLIRAARELAGHPATDWDVAHDWDLLVAEAADDLRSKWEE